MVQVPGGFNVLLSEGMRGVQRPRGLDVLFYDVRTVSRCLGGYNVLFYEGMRGVQGPGGFDVLFYDVRALSTCLGGSTSYSMRACEVSRL